MTTQISHNLIKTPYRKNAIINGDWSVNQRGSTTIALPDIGAFYGGDRTWYYNNRGTGAATLTRSTDVPTYAQAGTIFAASTDVDITTVFTSPTGNNEALILHRLEGYDYDRIRGSNGTFSFWVKSNKTGIYSASFGNAGADRWYVAEFTIDTADTWEKKVVTIPLTETGGTWNYTNGRGLQIAICLMTASTFTTTTLNQWNSVANAAYSTNNVNLFDNTANYFRTTGWQFEKGDDATDFERRPFVDELAMCQRYYYDWTGTNAYTWPINEGNIYREFQIQYPVTMRAIPTVTVTGGVVGGTFASTFPKVESRTIHGASCRGDVSVVSAYSTIQTFTADAEL